MDKLRIPKVNYQRGGKGRGTTLGRFTPTTLVINKHFFLKNNSTSSTSYKPLILLNDNRNSSNIQKYFSNSEASVTPMRGGTEARSFESSRGGGRLRVQSQYYSKEKIGRA